MSERVLLVSACLLGFSCRYDGATKRDEALLKALAGWALVPVCPEVAGGLPVPRSPVMFAGGDGLAFWRGEARLVPVRTSDPPLPLDPNVAFVRGAQAAKEAVKRWQIRLALLKSRSPSCGNDEITLSGERQPGLGICAALLQEEGLTLLSEKELDRFEGGTVMFEERKRGEGEGYVGDVWGDERS